MLAVASPLVSFGLVLADRGIMLEFAGRPADPRQKE